MGDMLERFGYTGNMGFNPLEMNAMQLLSELFSDRGDVAPEGAEFYKNVLGGGFGPEGEKYKTDVLGATRTSMMEELGKQQEGLADRFANVGGYFGGKHGAGQGELARGFLQDLTGVTAGLNYDMFNKDIGNRFGAATGQQQLGTTQAGVDTNLYNLLQSGGGMVTGREATNRAEYQNAMQRAYQDWIRGRQENMMPFQLGLSLLGLQPFENIVQQPNPSPWGNLLGGLGQGAGYAGTKAATKGM